MLYQKPLTYTRKHHEIQAWAMHQRTIKISWFLLSVASISWTIKNSWFKQESLARKS